MEDSVSNNYAVIMAGGRGERFWPQSRVSHPKQLLRLLGNLTLIEQTVKRLGKETIIPLENILIMTNIDYVIPMQTLLKNIPKENIIGEVECKDTAPCIALATAIIKRKTSNFDDAVMVVLPSDQAIKDEKSLQSSLEASIAMARQQKQMVTIGVKPTFPSTGYGYIQCKHDSELAAFTKTDGNNHFYKGIKFIEKPNLKNANKYIKSDEFRWNSGIFIWSLTTIYKNFKSFTPQLATFIDLLINPDEDLNEMIRDYYPELNKISIDYAIMEHISDFSVIECTFDWDDVGCWTAIENQIIPGVDHNFSKGTFESINSYDNIVITEENHLVATIGMKDTIIVHTDDATLVCSKESAQLVKDLVQKLSDNDKMKKFL